MKAISLFILLLVSAFSLHSKEGSYEEIADRNNLEIRTPSLTCRKTAKIRLDNGLEALLISDPQASQSAAALSMEVGSWSDPFDYPGMAHFTEHLLFMGSHTYPEENSYFKQVTTNGGRLNAFTTSDCTVYMFTVNHDAFPLTLDYFSHMFIDPLFTESRIGRELHAVDQEHDKNIENDGFREYMIMKDIGNPYHPNARFATGNAKTLGGIPHQTVIDWYQKNYSSDKAHLVCYASLPIDKLKQLVVTYFSSLPLNSSPKAEFPEKLTSSNQKGSITYITPVKEIRELSVYWELPESFFRDLEDKSNFFLSYILNSRHPESLYSKLKNRELIENLCVGCDPFSKESGFYAVDFALTPQGVKQIDQICQQLFQTLNAVRKKGIPFYIFNETKNMAKIDYEYQGRGDPFQFVKNAAHQMPKESLETFPQYSILPTTYNPDQCTNFINHLNPRTAQYTLKAPPSETGVQGDKVEKWSGAQYAVRKLSEAQLTSWEHANVEEPNTYPLPNPFIPDHLELVTEKRDDKQLPLPELLVDNEYGKVYYWEDGRYLVPEISWIISFRSPYLNQSPNQIALAHLYNKCLNDHLISTSYYAGSASLTSAIQTNDYKFTLYINGFSQKAPILLETILNGLKTCDWTKEEFELNRSLFITQYENFRKTSPLNQGVDLMKHVLFDSYPTKGEELQALQNLSYEDFCNFKAKFLNQAYAELMLAGNLTKKDAQTVWNSIQKKLAYTPYLKEQHLNRRYLVLSDQLGPYKLHKKIESLGHGATLVIQEGPFSFEKNASSAILANSLSEDFFDTLRTKQQTAYITQSGKVDDDGHLFQFFFVQSSTHQPDELIARFELFLEDYVKDFESKISEGAFENIRANLMTRAKQMPDTLAEMASRLYALAFKYHGDFHYVEKKIDGMASLDYETFKKDSLSFLSRSNSKRIAIMLEGESPEGKKFRYQTITAEELKNRNAYMVWKPKENDK